jgi:uncharacterized protein (TIGR03437 family)
VLQQTVATTAPVIANGGIISADQFGEFVAMAPGSFIEIYGVNLATATRQWELSDFTGNNAPTNLNGTTVTVNGQSAFVSYISPGQVNVQVPTNIPTGILSLQVNSPGGSSASYQVVVNALEPGLFAPQQFNYNGMQYAAAFDNNNNNAFALPGGIFGASIDAHPAAVGDILTFYGIGFGPVTTDVPAGQVAQGLNPLASFDMFIGGTPATVQYAGLAPNYVGLYQFNVQVPLVSANNAVPVTFTVNGVAGTQTLYIAVQ